MANSHVKVEFKTIDGITLRGLFYPTASVAPALILTPGLPSVKEMQTAELAQEFQRLGINALVYDPRHIGESDGEPRLEIDPAKQVTDYSDALTFLLEKQTVDRERIGFWGMSFSATVALCAASLDKRAKLCIAACPFLDLEPEPFDRIPRVLAKVMADRESRLAGNPPTYLPMMNPVTGKNPAGLSINPSEEEIQLVLTAQERGAVNFDNRSTLETYAKFIQFTPERSMKHLAPTPVCVIVPEYDTWSLPEKQMMLYESLTTPKRLYKVPKGHLTLFNGEEFTELMQMQVEFMRSAFEGAMAC